jgi:ABC-type Fe2+-enterobactin transport system substrate-binding protein
MGTVVYRSLDESETVSTGIRLWWFIIASTAMTMGGPAFAAAEPRVAEGSKTPASTVRDRQHDWDGLAPARIRVTAKPQPVLAPSRDLWTALWLTVGYPYSVT